MDGRRTRRVRIGAVAGLAALVVLLLTGALAALLAIDDGSGAPSPTTSEALPVVAAEIATLADRTTMTDTARRTFYGSDPELVDKAVLATRCPVREATSVLGCFGRGRVVILRVDDPRLDGMEETTAAHELLHAVWAGLPEDDRSRLRRRLRAVYAASTDPRLREKVETYRSRDPAVVDNELHSILGTEVAALPPALERHYARFFADRAAVVALAAAAQGAFVEREATVAQLDAELSRQRTVIQQEDARLASDREQLDARTDRLEQLRNEGRIEEYNAEVVSYNELVAAFNERVAGLRAAVERFNTLVVDRNALAAEYRALADTVDTSVATPSSVPR
jgi:hypothetical protein